MKLRARPYVAAVAVTSVLAAMVLPGWRAAIAGAAAMLLFLAFGSEAVARVSSTSGASSAFERAGQVESYAVDRPPDLDELERTFGWKAYSARDFHHWIRPQLVRLIRYKLYSKHGINLETQPQKAYDALHADLVRVVDGTGDPDKITDMAGIAHLLDEIERL